MEQREPIESQHSKPSPLPVGDDLEPYRRLVETQRQVIELLKSCEQSKLECASLRERLARDGVIPGDNESKLVVRATKFTSRQAKKILRIGTRIFQAMETGVTIRYK